MANFKKLGNLMALTNEKSPMQKLTAAHKMAILLMSDIVVSKRDGFGEVVNSPLFRISKVIN